MQIYARLCKFFANYANLYKFKQIVANYANFCEDMQTSATLANF